MKKILMAALLAASIGTANAESIEANAPAYDNMSVTASTSTTYSGKAKVTEMNGKSLSRTESASFDYNASTGDIKGDFSIVLIHTLELDGNVYSGATGTITMLITGTEYEFTATFTNVVLDGNTLSFDCTAYTSEGKESKFSFTGTAN